jgi:hypothetical protein
MKLGEWLTEGSERGSPKARREAHRRLEGSHIEGSKKERLSLAEARRDAHRRLVESTMKLGEWLIEGSERGTPKSRRGAHRRLEGRHTEGS